MLEYSELCNLNVIPCLGVNLFMIGIVGATTFQTV